MKKRTRYQKWKRIILIVVLLALILISIRCALTGYQQLIYDEEDYDCNHMSRDCEDFFEFFGIRTQIVHGVRFEEGENTTIGHCWLLVWMPWGEVEFESTSLMFCNVSNKYEVLSIKEDWSDYEW